MSDWQPIETAPKDGTRVLLYRPGSSAWAVVAGHYDDQRYHCKPRPYWTHDAKTADGVLSMRANPPTHWMPLPSPPKPAEGTPDEMVLALVDSVGDVRAYTRVNGDHPADVAAWLTDRAAPAWPGQVVRVMPMATILKQQRGRRE